MTPCPEFPDNPAGLAAAAQVLAGGGVVAFPTETVFGLGADARDATAVAKIYAAKGRPSFNPLIAHVADAKAACELVEVSTLAADLMAAFWPGPLTLVLPLRAGAGIAPNVTAGLPTLAVRAPAHPTAQGLLKAFGGPLAAPSANPSGKISPTTADHVRAGLTGRIDGIVLGAPSHVGLESTILQVDGQNLVLLRPGAITPDMVTAATGFEVVALQEPTQITAPGQMVSHYAPDVAVRLAATKAKGEEVLIGFGEVVGDLSLSVSGDLREAAEKLFAILHQANSMGRPIAIAPIPETGIGLAINDRLRRAAAAKE